MTKQVAKMRLEKCTRDGSDIRKLGELFLDNGFFNTGTIAGMFPFRPSIFSQMRRTFRSGDCWGEHFVATKIPGSTPQYRYELVTRES